MAALKMDLRGKASILSGPTHHRVTIIRQKCSMKKNTKYKHINTNESTYLLTYLLDPVDDWSNYCRTDVVTWRERPMHALCKGLTVDWGSRRPHRARCSIVESTKDEGANQLIYGVCNCLIIHITKKTL